MKYKFEFCILLLFCVLIGVIFAGCDKQTIKFYRESEVQKAIKDLGFNQDKPKTYNSSGVVIYKPKQEELKRNVNVNFGPDDLDFDMKFRF